MAIERKVLEEVAAAHGYPKDAQVLRYLEDTQKKLEAGLKREAWEGVKVLDVACGNGAPEDSELKKEREFQYLLMAPAQAELSRRLHELGRKLRQPWVCRLLSAQGAEVTGVDWKHPRYLEDDPLTESGWTFVQRDLTQPSALDPRTFRTESFDLVTCKDFIGPDATAAPELMTLRDRSMKAYTRIEEGLLLQISRVLKKDGLFLWNEKPLRPKGQRFLPVR